MDLEDGETSGPEAPFPRVMQGRWVEESDPGFVVVISGGRISWGGVDMEYIAKTVAGDEGAVAVVLEPAYQEVPEEDSINLYHLWDGEMYVYNIHFASRFIRLGPAPHLPGSEGNVDPGMDPCEALAPDAPLPPEMQGRWIKAEDPSYEVLIEAREIIWREVPLAYKGATVTRDRGAVVVELRFADDIAGEVPISGALVAWPRGDMFAFNRDGVINLVRPTAAEEVKSSPD